MTARKKPLQWGRGRKRETGLPSLPPALPPELSFLGSWSWRDPQPGETIRQWVSRQDLLRAELEARAANWCRPGQRVRILHEPSLRSIGGRLRTGTIIRPGTHPFADYVRVELDLTGRQTSRRIRFLALETIEPL
ncbi:hypothetical protein [Beijerinckia mobilis]|uniref:hypothetical protein n=1 Tax=Beijerinckia mobilis TaxID=231434 RepID=UPI000559129F|nr:hypothetical protein [Beijerinckia mobilis]